MAVIVAGRLEGADHRPAIGSQNLDQAIVLSPAVENSQRRRRLWWGASIRTSLRTFAISMATNTASAGVGCRLVMVGLSGMEA